MTIAIDLGRKATKQTKQTNKTGFLISPTWNLVSNGHSKIDKTNIIMTNGNEGRKYCRILPLEHSAILLTCIMRYLVLKTKLMSSWEWPFYTGFTVHVAYEMKNKLSLQHMKLVYGWCKWYMGDASGIWVMPGKLWWLQYSGHHSFLASLFTVL